MSMYICTYYTHLYYLKYRDMAQMPVSDWSTLAVLLDHIFL